ncbi:MAG: response regulator transcription factor [Saprospiraceae bacterium]|nr:response regulator transcription factor [Saprospiraceae bacterium]
MKVIILEDEKLASSRLIRMLKELRPELEILAELGSLLEADQFFENHISHATDVLFFDIQLGDGLSFELFERFKIEGVIIFTTAYDQYALKAIKVKAFDYLLKPIKINELESILERIDDLLLKTFETTEKISKNEDFPLRFLVKIGRSLKIVTIDEVAYFYSDHKMSLILTWNGKKYPIDQSLNRIEEILPQDLFFRLNRKLIVHLKAIDEMQVYSKSRIKINLKPPIDEEVLVSTEKASLFKRWLGGEIPGFD